MVVVITGKLESDFVFEGLFPFSHQEPFLDLPVQKILFKFAGEGSDDPVDVSEVFLGFPFPIEFQLADDDVFRGSELETVLIEIDGTGICESPKVKGVTIDKVEVGLESCLVVNQICVALFASLDFFEKDLGWRAVKLIKREGANDKIDFLGSEPKDDIDIVGQSGFAVIDRGDASSNHVAEGARIERIGEVKKRFKWWHWKRFRKLLCRFFPKSSWGAVPSRR